MDIIKNVFLQILFVLNWEFEIFEFNISLMSIIVFTIIGYFLIMFIKVFMD